jgi:16S rRNA (cytosine967-C5)-methyltransferase
VARDDVRDAAVRALLRVCEEDWFVDAALDKALRRRSVSERARRFLTHLVYGTVRHRTLEDHILGGVVSQPLDELPRPILAILRMGVYQGLFLNQVPHPAMVHSSVELAKHWGHMGLAKLTNAVLKRVPQRLEDVSVPPRASDFEGHLRVRYSMPGWLVAQWRTQFGDPETEALCMACNEQAPTTLRANLLRTRAETLTAAMNKAGYPAEKRTPIPEEVTLPAGGMPARAKAFQTGLCIVQDAASMLAAPLLDPAPGETVLDLCSAPGGKTTHLAERAGGEARVVALDRSARKLTRLMENVARLETPGVHPVAGDGAAPPFGTVFDRVLVDAPCSGLGTLRRHPELKYRAQPGDATRLADAQRTLLRAALALCKNDGVVVYSVCTTTPEETDGVVDRVIEDGTAACDDGPAWMDVWKTSTGRYRTLPNRDGLDGFFLTRLRKRS